MKYFAALLLSAVLFVACGDDDSSSFVEPEKESSSSEILSSGDGTSDGNGDKSSSSVSSSTTNSSSSAKSSSSTDAKSSGGDSSPASSSVKSSSSGTSAGTNSSSSLKTCPPEKEGNTRTVMETGEKQLCKDGYWVPVSSSSAVPTSSYFDMTNQFNEKVSYGEFTDPRDGQKYRTVSLKDGVYYTDSLVFFAENLNFGKIISGGAVQGDSTKYCYDDDLWYCENGWGGLYTWSNAMNLPSVCDSVEFGSEKCNYTFARDKDGKLIDGEIIHQGICPEGWHIANDGEWAYLQEKSGNSVAHYMGSKVAGFGSNDYGLSILPTGYWLRYENNTTLYKLIKVQTFFWLPQQSSLSFEKAFLVSIASQNMSRLSEELKSKRAFSIRCVKNR